MNKDFNLNDDVIMKKQHACGTNLWTITRNGADVKIKCKNCGRLFRIKGNIDNNKSKTNELNRTQYCRRCFTTYEPKYKGKDEMSLDYKAKKGICVDCGNEFYIENYKDTETCRCKDCNLIYQRARNAKKNKAYRERKKYQA